MGLDGYIQLFFSGITIGSIYAMVALGFLLIYSSTGIINLAQGEFVMLGGMIAVTCNQTLHMPIWLTFIVAVLSVTAIGAIFELVCIHPLKNASVLGLIMITIAASIVMRGTAMFVWGKEEHGIPPFSGNTPVDVFGRINPSSGSLDTWSHYCCAGITFHDVQIHFNRKSNAGCCRQ